MDMSLLFCLSIGNAAESALTAVWIPLRAAPIRKKNRPRVDLPRAPFVLVVHNYTNQSLDLHQVSHIHVSIKS